MKLKTMIESIENNRRSFVLKYGIYPDYILLHPMDKEEIPPEWKNAAGLEIMGMKVLTSVEAKPGDFVLLGSIDAPHY